MRNKKLFVKSVKSVAKKQDADGTDLLKQKRR